jgi:endonuclease-3
MQGRLDFGAASDLVLIRDRLRPLFGRADHVPPLDPVSQMVRSMLGSRTKDEESWRVFWRLRDRCPDWNGLADMPPDSIETLIDGVNLSEKKARFLPRVLRRIRAERGALDLNFLGGHPLATALAWLEALPGVGPKVAASVLNFSTLAMPAFVVDTHVGRVLRRFGLVDGRAETREVRDAVMATACPWDATALRELHALLKRLGQQACHAAMPDCRACPLRAQCGSRRHGLARLVA